MVNNVVKFFILFSVIGYNRIMPMQIFDGNIFYVAVICLFIASLFDKPKREITNKYLIASLLGLLLFNIYQHGIKAYIVVYAAKGLLSILALKIIVEYCDNLGKIYDYFIYGVVINLLLFFLQTLGYFPVLTNSHKSFYGGFMGNLPRLSTYLCLVLPYILNKSFLLFCVCIITCVFLSPDPQTAILFIGAVLLTAKYKFGFISFIGLAAGLYFVYGEVLNSLNGRFSKWREMLTSFFSRPISGFGFGYIEEFTKDAHKDATIHSSLLQFVVEGGVLCSIWLYQTIKEFFRRCSKSVESMGVLSLILLSTFEYPVEMKRLSFTIICVVAFFLIKQGENNGSFSCC